MQTEDQALHLAEQIVELRRQLREAESKFRVLLRPGTSGKGGHGLQGGSNVDAVLAALNEAEGKAMTAEELIARGVKMEPRALRSTLARLAKHGRIEKTKRGVYRAKT